MATGAIGVADGDRRNVIFGQLAITIAIPDPVA
jgi:hypothetical protein